MSKKKFADAKAIIVFYGVKTIHGTLDGLHIYRRNFVSVQKPNIVVEVELKLKKDWWQKENRIDIDKEMNKLAKKYFPKVEDFMFYNRVSSIGIVAPPPKPPKSEKFNISKKIL